MQEFLTKYKELYHLKISDEYDEADKYCTDITIYCHYLKCN